jgi:hypothetical protein
MSRPEYQIGSRVEVINGYGISNHAGGAWRSSRNVFVGLTAIVRKQIKPDNASNVWGYVLTFPSLSQQAMHSEYSFGVNKDGYVPKGIIWDERELKKV